MKRSQLLAIMFLLAGTSSVLVARAHAQSNDEKVKIVEDRMLREAGWTSAAERAAIHERAQLEVLDRDRREHEASERAAREKASHDHPDGGRSPQGERDHADKPGKPEPLVHEPHFHDK
jgi:hypothetical protein